MIDELWKTLTTLSDEAQQTATEKCKELGFDPNRGVISLDESFVNLTDLRDLLKEAIEKKKLIQLPISIQRELQTDLVEVGRTLTALGGGADEVVNLVTAIERLNTAIWKYGFHNLADEILGYQTKLNQLKSIRAETTRLKRELEGGLEVRDKLLKLSAEAGDSLATIRKLEGESSESEAKSTAAAGRVDEADQAASAALAAIKQKDNDASKSLATSKQSSADVAAVEARIKEFHGEIDQYKATIQQTQSSADIGMKANEDRTSALIDGLKKLEAQISEQITRATGFSLFHSFQIRQEALAKSKKFWISALALLVGSSIALTFYVAKTTTVIDRAFYIKLSFSLPIVYAITFCTLQYSRERRLEEEYAFKSNISISLEPYEQLVGRLLEKGKPIDAGRFTDFVIDSVTKVFSSPTERVFDAEASHATSGKDVGSQVKEILSPVSEILDPILKFIKRG